MIPSLDAGYVPGNTAAATVAVMRGARTVREVMAACGWTSAMTSHLALKDAAARGLIAWDDRGPNDTRLPRTMRPAIGVVVR